MRAFLAERERVCQACGTTDEDWLDPETKRVLDDPPYEAVVERCYGCAELAGLQKQIPDGQSGVRVMLARVREDTSLDT